MHTQLTKKFYLLFPVLIIITGFAMRIYMPGADPPHWSYVYNTDESYYAYNALNKLKQDQWFLNDAKYSLLTPLFSLLQYYTAKTLDGFSYVVRLRSINLLSGVLSVIVLAFFFHNNRMRLTTAALWAFSFIGIVYSRLGNPEMTLTLCIQVSVLLAWLSFEKRSFSLAFLAGIFAAASPAIKISGIFIFPVIILAVFLCKTENSKRNLYLSGVSIGIAAGLLIWCAFVIIPYYNEWSTLQEALTSGARDHMPKTLFQMSFSLLSLLLSPALLAMPLIWPMSLCWCIFHFLPNLRKRENSLIESLLFLWIVFGFAILSTSLDQPARWQLIIFPPVICTGLMFLFNNKSRKVLLFSLFFALSLSLFYALITDTFLKTDTIVPGRGIFSHPLIAAILFSIFFITFLITVSFKIETKKAIITAVIVLEIAAQIPLHSAYLLPSYHRISQWESLSKDVEEIASQNNNTIFSGDMVQDIALHADIEVLPTYFLMDEIDDNFIGEFFKRQGRRPTHFIIVEFNDLKWSRTAPLFMKSLEEIKRYPLLIGGAGFRRVILYRFKSYDWLETGKAVS